MGIRKGFWTMAAIAFAAPVLFASGGARLAITITDEKGAPVNSATVSLTTPSSDSFKLNLKTDARGRAQAILIRTDWNYIVHAQKAGAAARPTLVKLSSEESRSLSLALAPAPAEATAVLDEAEKAYRQGVELYNSGDFRGAGAIFARLTQEKRDMAKSYFQLAMCEYQLKRYAESRATFQRYLEMAPTGDQAAEAHRMLQTIPAN